jgi:CheY-like chemotaxis protein
VAKVLVVDDDPGMRAVIRRTLLSVGHEVWDAPDGAEALSRLDVLPFDVIIADVYMAPVDGMELLLRIEQKGLQIPVVVISGGGHVLADDVLDLARRCGAAATLDKPFTPEQLRDTVARVLAGGAPSATPPTDIPEPGQA